MSLPSPHQQDIEEVKRCLQEAGFAYDANTTEEDMRACYAAIKESEVSLREETEQRNNRSFDSEMVVDDEVIENNKSVANNEAEGDAVIDNNIPATSTPLSKKFKPKEWVNKKQSTQLERVNEAGTEPKQEKSERATKLTYKQIRDELNNNMDPFDCPPFQPVWECKDRTPKYDIPIYCQERVVKLSYKKRAEIIYRHHLAYEKHVHMHQLKSKDFAPWPKPIYASKTTYEKLVESPEIESSKFDPTFSPPPETESYTTIKGRQTKRKLYSEMSDIDVCAKKTKAPETAARNKRTMPPLKDDDLIKKSKIFADFPKDTRNKKIFEKLAQEDKERRLKEEQMNRFTLSVEAAHSSDEEFQSVPQETRNKKTFEKHAHEDNERRLKEERVDRYTLSVETEHNSDTDFQSIADIVHQEEPFRRRVIPPSGRRTYNKTATKGQAQNRLSNIKEVSITSKSDDSIMKRCPICNEPFPLEELLQHASNCGVEAPTRTSAALESPTRTSAVLESPTKTSTVRTKTTMCEVCDKLFTLSTDYEVHVRECIESKTRKDRKE